MLKAGRLREHRWVFLLLLAVLALGIVCIVAFAQQRRHVRAVTATATAEEAEYLFTNLNYRLEFLVADLQATFSSTTPQGQAEHESMTRHLVAANPFLVTINYISPERRIEFVSPFERNRAVIGLQIGIAAPKAALESADAWGVPHLSAPFEIVQGEAGYSLMIPHHSGGFLEIVFQAASVFGASSPFRRGTDLALEIVDSLAVYRTEGYFGQLSRAAAYRSRAEGTVFGRAMTMSAVPSDALLAKTAQFWEILGVSGLVAVLLLMLGIVVVQARRVTDRRHAEGVLRESEGRYRTLFERSHDAIFLVNSATGRYEDANAAAERLTGRTIEEMRTLTTADITPRGAPERLQQVAEMGESDDLGETTYLRPDGSERTATLSAAKLTDDLIYGIAHDITERKITEDQLRLQAQIGAHLAEGVLLIRARDNLIISANETSEKMFGYGRGELAGRQASVLIADGERSAKGTLAVMSAATAQQGVWRGEIANVRKDGARIWTMASASRFGHAVEGEVMVVVHQDITERKRMEEELRQSQLLASMGEMTAGIAHEVSNPLAAIALYAELVGRASLPTEVGRDVAIIRSEARRASKIVGDLLSYSRKADLARRRIDVHRILRKVTGMRRYQQQIRNVDAVTHLARGPLLVRGNSSQLTQLFMNVIVNAEEAVERSSVRRVVVTTESDAEWARISVADSGSGVPEEHLTQVFFPFFTTKRMGEGTGLGLSTCHGIVTAHRGLIHAENNDMGGATFVVELPLAGNRAADPATLRG